MALSDVLSGGPWVIAVGVAWLVFTGRLRLAREFEDLAKRYDDATSRLTAAQDKERASLNDSIARAEQRTLEVGNRLDRLIDQQAGRSQ